MQQSNYEILQDLFFGLARDPHSNKGIFEHYLGKIAGTEEWVLRKAVDELLATVQVLPKVNQLLMAVHKFTPHRDIGTAPCDICNAGGLVYGVFCYKEDGGRMEVASYNHTVYDDAVYRGEIIGRCKCSNGMAFFMSAHPTLANEVDPPPFLKDKADETGMDCLYEATECARYYNRLSHGFQAEAKPLKKSLQDIIDRAILKRDMEAEDAEFEEINPTPLLASKNVVQENIFKEGDVPF